MKCCLLTAIVCVLPTFCMAQDHSQMDHNAHMMQQGGMQQMGALPEMAPAPVQAGQSAFAAIQEIVTLMDQDPETDWFTVNIDALREHLVDMNNVTLFADVEMQGVDGGAVFTVTSDNPKVVQSIRNMVMVHAAMVSSESGLHDPSGTCGERGDPYCDRGWQHRRQNSGAGLLWHPDPWDAPSGAPSCFGAGR